MWLLFIGFVLVMLALDLGVLQRRSHVMSMREALLWSAGWIGLSLAFNAFIGLRYGEEAGLDSLTAYLIEKSLSVDNLFVFVVVFAALKVPAEHQHRVLFWGVLGALVFRAGLIFGGIALLHRAHWVVYPLGAFLVFTGWKLFKERNAAHGQEDSRIVKWLRERVPWAESPAPHFTVVNEWGRRVATPMLLALIAVELTDVLFAVDSVPAVLAVTDDTFIVFTSNICAMLGLRALYFALADAVQRFRHLKVGLAGVLVFVGAKMVTSAWVHVGPAISLAVIATLLIAAVLASLPGPSPLRSP